MLKDNSEIGNPLPPHGLLFPISSKGSFIAQDGMVPNQVIARLEFEVHRQFITSITLHAGIVAQWFEILLL